MNSNVNDESNSFAWYWLQKLKLTVKRLTKHWVILLIVLGIAIAFIIIRSYVIAVVPFMQSQIKLTTIAFNVLADTFVIMEDQIKIFIRIIQELRALFSTKYTPPPFHIIKFKRIRDNEVQAVLSQFVLSASELNTGPKATHFLLTYALNPVLCPIVRAATPTALGSAVHNLFGWLTVNPDPLLGSNSCQFDFDYVSVRIVAAFFAIGFIIIEILLPIYFGIIILYTLLWPTICTLVKFHERLITLLPETFGFEPVAAK